LLADSTQFVIPPVVSTKRVIGNCGAQSTSVPLKLPVTLVPKKTATDPSSRRTPFPPLPVIVVPPNDAAARDRGAILGNQCQSIHTLNDDVFFASARNGYRARPFRIANRNQMEGFTDGIVFVAIDANIRCLSVLACRPNGDQQKQCKNPCSLPHHVLLSHFSECGAFRGVCIDPPPTRTRPSSSGILWTHTGASHDALLDELVLASPDTASKAKA